MTLIWLPEATQDAHGRDLSWAPGKPLWRGVLHTTEGGSQPTYDNWAIEPHATILPTAGKGVTIRQHVPFTRASFSLVNAAGGAETNREFAFQFELIGTCAKGGPGYYWPDADDAVLNDLYRKLIKPLSDSFGIKLTAADFQAYPGSYGARGKTNTVRMSASAWDSFNGWCGHQHVPENDHGDPGAFPWSKMMDLQKAADVATTDIDMNQVVRTLTAAEATQINRTASTATQVKAGDPFTLLDVFTWGSIGDYRIWADLLDTKQSVGDVASEVQTVGAQVEAVAGQVTALTALVNQLIANQPKA